MRFGDNPYTTGCSLHYNYIPRADLTAAPVDCDRVGVQGRKLGTLYLPCKQFRRLLVWSAMGRNLDMVLSTSNRLVSGRETLPLLRGFVT